jgi:hypothetical protein
MLVTPNWTVNPAAASAIPAAVMIPKPAAYRNMRWLTQIRVQGFATDDGAAGIQGVAAPVFALAGLKGAIGASLLPGSAPSLYPVADDVRTTAARATIALGGITPDRSVFPPDDRADQSSVARVGSACLGGCGRHGGRPCTGSALERFPPLDARPGPAGRSAG